MNNFQQTHQLVPARPASAPQPPRDAGVLPRSVSNSPTRSASQRIDDLLRKKREKDMREMRGGAGAGGGIGDEEEQFVRAAEKPKGQLWKAEIRRSF